jgi:hypothetical protein
MKRFIGTTVCVLVIVVLLVAVSPAARDELGWRSASKKDQIPSYSAYLNSWPGGRHAAEASARRDDLSWELAKNSVSVQMVESYLEEFPDGRHSGNAQMLLEELPWREADEAGTIAACRAYLEAHPSGSYVTEASEKIERLRNDDTPYTSARREGTREAYEGFLAQFPGHKREKDIRSVLRDLEGRDLSDLIAEKKVEARATGSSIKTVSLRVRRLVDHTVTVRIPPGTFFVSHSSSAQNMVTRRSTTVELKSNEWVDVSVSAACANRERDIPDESHSFSIRRSPHRKELEKLMPALDKAGADFAVEQAAVWIITDNADYDDLGSLVSGFGGFGPRVIGESDAAQAMRIISQAGIDIRRKAIWRNRHEIAAGVDDQELKNWLLNKW